MNELAMASGLSMRELISILLRRRGLILIAAALIMTVICACVLLVSFQYTAKAQLEIEVQQSGLIGGQAGVFGQPADEPSVQTEMAALTSQDHERHVLDSLLQDPTFRAAEVKANDEAAAVDDTWLNTSATWLRTAWLSMIGASGDLTLRQLERHLNVYQERGSHVIGVAYTSTSADEAALIANRVTQLYVERRGDQKRASTDRALAWLGDRLPQVKEEADRLEAAAQSYRSAHYLEDTKRASVIDQQLMDLHKRLSAAEADLAVQQARFQTIHKMQLSGGNTGDIGEQMGSELLVGLHTRELKLLQAEAAERVVSFSDNQPKLVQIRSELREVRRQIGAEADRALLNLVNQIAVSAAGVKSIQQSLDKVESASSVERLGALEREARVSRQQYETLLQRREELYQQRQSLSPGVHILSLAWPPNRTNSPNPLLFIVPALIASLIVGSLLAIAKERLDRTFRSERDIVNTLGVPCLGLVPKLRRLRGRRPHDILRDRPFDPYTESIRSLVAALQIRTIKRTPKTILISSSVPGEGKTTLAVSFATYAAMIGNRVLLIDLDFRHPEILRELGSKDNNLLDFVQAQGSTSELINNSAELQFDYLPINRLSADPLMPFTSGQISRLLLQLREKYDCLIIDSAPLLAITETRVLARMVDKVVLVVKWGSTRPDVVRNALALLRAPGAGDVDKPDPVSVVITQVDLKKHARYRYGDSGEIFMKYKKYYTHA
jgi:polysaccharide biosynthesis transport protein